MVSLDDLTELLAEAEGTTPEEIKRAAAEFGTAPPWEGTLVDEEPTLSFSRRIRYEQWYRTKGG